jgi:poly(3-hydroxybutyrate) depolymerase
MPFQPNNPILVNTNRTYDIFIPSNPTAAVLPAIIVFKGGGQEILTIERRWGMPTPPVGLDKYIMVFPETDPTLTDEWVHFKIDDSAFPNHDLLFVQTLIDEITTTAYATGNPAIPTVSANPELLYVAGFSNGSGLDFQLAYSDMVDQFQGFAAVGKSLDPEKVQHFRQQLAGQAPPPIPFVFIMGTADSGFTSPRTLQEVPLDTTHPFFTLHEMLTRNGYPNGAMEPMPAPAQTTLVPGSSNATEVVIQLFLAGTKAFGYVTVINGGHNWPSPTTMGNPPVAKHFNATEMIIDFWQNHAGLPL